MGLILTTERLLIRPLESSDLDFMAKLLGDKDVTRYYPKQYTRAEAQGWIDKQQARYHETQTGLFLVEEALSGEPLGIVGLLERHELGRQDFELGYLIHSPYWRRGYAYEAGQRWLRYAFEDLQRDRVLSYIRPINKPSLAVSLKHGMSPLVRIDYGGFPHQVMALTAAQWRARL